MGRVLLVSNIDVLSEIFSEHKGQGVMHDRVIGDSPCSRVIVITLQLKTNVKTMQG